MLKVNRRLRPFPLSRAVGRLRPCRAMRSPQAGFTLLEVLVATLIMGIALAGVLGGLAGASRNTLRLTTHDRATMLAKQKMDELLVDRDTPRNQAIGGPFNPADTGGVPYAWRARVVPFESFPGAGAGAPAIDRIELEISWMDGPTRRSFTLEGFRRNVLRLGDPTFR